MRGNKPLEPKMEGSILIDELLPIHRRPAAHFPETPGDYEENPFHRGTQIFPRTQTNKSTKQ